ncbi:MAG TPA: hypothetical protein VNJ46_03495 [Gaiellaceae bacterium]|nr:hypothetical protein [Gaiellaceae bacterium]
MHATTRALASADLRLRGAAVILGYVALGLLMAWTRLAGLDRSYWHDELVTVEDFVRRGPGVILAGEYIPNNHQLFSLLAWATTALAGESEALLRLWSVLPFLLGVVLVTGWLHRRVGPLSGLAFLYLVALSPLLLDISRQARGYGLAVLAMSCLVVVALELERGERPGPLVAAFCVASVAGTWTFPHFALAFAATAAVLFRERRLRRPLGAGVLASAAAIAVFYAPHAAELATNARQEYGTQIAPLGILTAPIDQVLVPAFLGIDGYVVFFHAAWLPLVAALALLLGSSPLLRSRWPALVLTAPVVATVAAFWALRLYAAPRFFSFLLVPLLMLLASGAAAVLGRRRPPLVRGIVALAGAALLSYYFATAWVDVVRLPREAHRDAAEVIRAYAPGTTPVFAYMGRPRDLDFYLDRPFRTSRRPALLDEACESRLPVAIVVQPWLVRPVPIPCGGRPGTRRFTLRQYSRGERLEVWLIPPARA